MTEGKLARDIFALVLIFWGLLLLVSLGTYHPADPSFNQLVAGGAEVHNAAGLVGSYLGGLLVDFFGLGGYVWPLGFLAAGAGLLFRPLSLAWWRWLGLGLFVICLMTWAAAPWAKSHLAVGHVAGGGFIGALLYAWSRYFLRPVGASLLWLVTMAAALQLMTGATWAGLTKRLHARLEDFYRKLAERHERRARLKEAKGRTARDADAGGVSPTLATPVEGDEAQEGEQALSLVPKRAKPNTRKAAAKPSPPADARTAGSPHTGFLDTSAPFPPLSILTQPQAKSAAGPDAKALAAQGEALTACLADFGVQGGIEHISPGPVVTTFEYKPAPGVKIAKIAGLSDDVALALKARAVRVEAPIPGKDLVGVEIPNEHRENVLLREIVTAPSFAEAESPLTLALGKDITGAPFTADLARMPHLLVAGATGAGKSVCLNSILVSFLYKAAPEDLKLLLVDPKRIELSVYADLPHLVHPVVTEMALAKNALDWAVAEMDRRYESMARLAVRNLSGYNEKLAKLGEDAPEELADLAASGPMPFLVIVIDELADLMLTAGKEAEMSIVRLAQLARAAGIHMILATQRPSVDVVTGLIKANFPCRISFQVTSKHDSRTILDTVGAEHLLGKGDMLFKPSGGKMKRLHGAFVSDDEVQACVDFWKAKAPQQFDIDFAEWGGEGGAEGGLGAMAGELDNDPLYQEALDFVQSQGKASISLIQRRFRIGFNRAARFVEQMEADGVVGPADGAKPRPVLKGE